MVRPWPLFVDSTAHQSHTHITSQQVLTCNVQARHGGELICLPVRPGLPRPFRRRAQKSIEVIHGHARRLALQPRRVYDMKDPFHLRLRMTAARDVSI